MWFLTSSYMYSSTNDISMETMKKRCLVVSLQFKNNIFLIVKSVPFY
jgi:hypothetical protein